MQPNALIPELAVADCARSLAFYCAVLGFSRLYARPEEGFALLGLGEAQVMIDEIGKGRSFGLGAEPSALGRGLNLQIMVPSIDPLLTALAEAGIGLALAPEVRWYRRARDQIGQRQFMVADPDGYLLRFAEPLGVKPL